MMGLIVLALPTLIGSTGLRHWLVNQAIDDPQLEATVGSASFGWLTPVALDNLQVRHVDQIFQADVTEIRTQKSWLGFLASATHLGKITIRRPRLDLVLGSPTPPKPEISPSAPSQVTFSAVVRDAEITLRQQVQAKPIIRIDHLRLTTHVEPAGSGRQWTIEPTRLIDRLPLTPELCDRGLQLVAPLLGQSVEMQGQVSLELESFRVPLDMADPQQQAQQVEITGFIELHQATASLKTPLLQDLTTLVAQLLQREPPEQMQIVDNTRVRFQVQDGRVVHESFAFVLPQLSPELVVRSSGSVGLDESLDLKLQIEVPESLVGTGPLARRLTSQPLALQITGTISKPKLAFGEQRGWLERLQGLLGSDGQPTGEEPLAGAILDAVRGLLDESAEEDRPAVWQRLRTRREERAEATPEERRERSQRRRERLRQLLEEASQ